MLKIKFAEEEKPKHHVTSRTTTTEEMTMSKTKINADGEVVRVGDDESSSSVLTSGNTLDIFGFNLEWRQFLIVLGVLSFMIGLRGSE